MARSARATPSTLAEVELGTQGRAVRGLPLVREYLQHYGYLPDGGGKSNRLDGRTAEGLRLFQRFVGLDETGDFDEATRSLMTEARCGMPDPVPTFATVKCRWQKASLSYVLDTGTADVAGQGEWDAVRAAFATWQALGILSFRQVTLQQEMPDIFLDWRPADDPDLSLVGGALAHADFPPGCSILVSQPPLPIHFDDSEHTWSTTPTSGAGAYDVETVALHEIGHILGLEHSSVSSAVMWPFVSADAQRRSLSQDDIDGFNFLYKDVSVPDVIGDTRREATAALNAAGLSARFVGAVNGEVVSQNPNSGRLVKRGTVVTCGLRVNPPISNRVAQ